MISSLPLLTEVAVDVEQTKLALAFLKTISNTMADNNKRNSTNNSNNRTQQNKQQFKPTAVEKVWKNTSLVLINTKFIHIRIVIAATYIHRQFELLFF